MIGLFPNEKSIGVAVSNCGPQWEANNIWRGYSAIGDCYLGFYVLGRFSALLPRSEKNWSRLAEYWGWPIRSGWRLR